MLEVLQSARFQPWFNSPSLSRVGYEFRKRSTSFGASEFLDEVSVKLNGVHWRALELGTTIDYLRQAENLSLEEAIDRALKLKPACSPHQESALEVLRTLGLS